MVTKHKLEFKSICEECWVKDERIGIRSPFSSWTCPTMDCSCGDIDIGCYEYLDSEFCASFSDGAAP